MQKVIGLALVAGLVAFAVSAYLLNTMGHQNSRAALTGEVPFVQIPAVVHYPIVNGIVAAVLALIVGLLVMIASNGRSQRSDDRELSDQRIMQERLRRHVGTRE
jgi:hypothetical protein